MSLLNNLMDSNCITTFELCVENLEAINVYQGLSFLIKTVKLPLVYLNVIEFM